MGRMKGKGGGGGKHGGAGPKKKNKHYRAPGGKKAQDRHNMNKPEPPKNPFEIQTNKRKHETLGRISKSETGVPGVSRSRAIQKRKSTLLQEYKVRGKSNVLVDNRIGEKNKNMAEEDKIVRRSALEKSRMFKKKSIFNLNDDDDDFLTHKGKTLNDVQRYDDPRDLSDSEDERLNEDFVSEAHFGGFLKMKKGGASQELDEASGEPKTRDQIIAEMILESKKRKAEKAKELDENYEKVQELDDEFKDPEFRSLLNQLNAPSKSQQMEAILQRTVSASTSSSEAKSIKPSDTDIIKREVKGDPPPAVPESKSKNKKTDEKQSEYDRLIRELQFEKKTGLASNRKKTQDEILEESQEKEAEKTETKRKRNHDKMVLIMRAFNDLVISDMNSIQKGFDLCDITYEILSQWRKYCPEVIIFLTSLLKCFDETQFKKNTQPGLSSARNLLRGHPCWIFNTLDQISRFVLLYKYLPSSYELFKPTLKLVQSWKLRIEEQVPPPHSDQVIKFKNAINQVIENITSTSTEKKEPVQMTREKPVALKLYEPAIDDTFDGVRKRKSSNKNKQVQERLQHKVKREMKSAIREIKKDNAFISRVIRKEEHAKDEERKRKVKELLGDLANQEGDYKKSKRVKKS